MTSQDSDAQHRAGARRALTGTAPSGPYSPGLEVAAGGRLVFVSGQGPSEDGVLVRGSIEDETRRTLANVGRVLASAGAGFEHVVRCGVFLAELEDFAGMNRVYEQVFADLPRPSRTTVGAALLDGIKVEIDAIAVVPSA